jgi:hypothetical protein
VEMMFAACSDSDDTPAGDTPVPTESYETLLGKNVVYTQHFLL